MSDVSRILQQIESGDPFAAERLLPLVYDELRKLAASQAAPGTMIAGRYKLIEAIGEGGMGTVWLAEQKEPVKRKVAIKLVKAGMDSKSVLARFEAERQALAMMDHPNIAKVFDGGMTEQGRPYFVMEFVKGVPLTEYLFAGRNSVRTAHRQHTARTTANEECRFQRDPAADQGSRTPETQHSPEQQPKSPQYRRAAEHRTESAEARTSLPTESPQLAGQLAQFSMVLLTLKAWDEAEPLIREALTIREAKEPDDWRTFNTKSMLGGVLLGQKKYAEAEPLLLAGSEGLQLREAAIPPNGKIRIPEALERLVLLYTDWHAAEPDKGHDAKAAEWQTKLREHQAAANAEPSPTTGNAK